MPFDIDQELQEKFRDDAEDRLPNFFAWLVTLLVGALMWFGIWLLIVWLVGAL